VIEAVFNLPGVGQLLFTSIRQQQGTVVVGVATALVLIFLVLNLLVDVLYGLLDPRIRVV
jgi:ABC-type dipeptide/oligopeptide/nickel transport system permease component